MAISVLFVCLGNICRSPLAEGAFRAEAARLGLEVDVDSAGTESWHVGRPPDVRAIAVGLKNGVDISGLRARQVSPQDFARFDHIVALDPRILAELQTMEPVGAKGELSLMLDHVAGRAGQAVADPYYGGGGLFDFTWSVVTEGAKGLARKIAGAG